PQQISDLLVRMAPFVGMFMARLFKVTQDREHQIALVREEMDTIFTFRREVVMKCEASFKNENPSTWNIPQIQRNLELLIRIALPEIHRGDPDSEHAVARVSAKLWRLANHFETLDQGKSSDYPNADEEVLEIRARLKADPE